MSVPSTVKRKIVCIQDGQRYHIATLIIRPHKGEVLYIPSQKGIKSPEEKEYQNLDHISFHTDGLVHLKYKFALLTYKTVRQYLPIEKMGYQEMINDTIQDIKSLPQTSESKLEIVFNVDKDNQPVHLPAHSAHQAPLRPNRRIAHADTLRHRQRKAPTPQNRARARTEPTIR